MQILLVGNFGAHNLGDELILCAALEDSPGATVMTSDGAHSQNFCEKQFQTTPFPPIGFRSLCRFLVNQNYRTDILALLNRDFDTIVFPGGGLFAIKWQACALWFGVFLWLRMMYPATKFRFEHQGVDQGLGWLSRQLTRWVFARADFISVRDAASGKALEVLGIKNYVLGEDRVFAYLKQLNFPARPESGEKLLLVNAINSFGVRPIEKKYPDHRIVFVPFEKHDMQILSDDFAHEVIWPKTKTELFELFASAEVSIGERFHSLVLGQHFCDSKNTYSLRAPYSEKVEAFCDAENIKRFA